MRSTQALQHVDLLLCVILYFSVLQSCYYCFIFSYGYLCCKTITSQNVTSETQVKIFFILWKSYVPFSDIQVFVFLIIPSFTKSVTSWLVLLHETGCIFEKVNKGHLKKVNVNYWKWLDLTIFLFKVVCFAAT